MLALAPPPPPPPPPIVAPCPAEARELRRGVRCGYVTVPLDRARPGGKTIRVYFERYPRRNRKVPRVSTVVSLEGGPGYPVTTDRAGRFELWWPVSSRRDLVLVDLRGTGGSTALGCRAFSWRSAGYIPRAGRCAAQIGPKRDLFSTSQAVQDIEAVLRSLRAGRIDLYGDSYGTYAAQAYALRYPGRLRSLTLDGAYPLPGTDPAWADLVEAIRIGLELTCSRARPAARRAIRSSSSRASPTGCVRPRSPASPRTGTARGRRCRLDEDALVQLVSAGYWYPALWRDLPAAIRAAERGDNAPILRLAAETVVVEAGVSAPRDSSEALYLSVICHDYPQLWDPSTRRWRCAGPRPSGGSPRTRRGRSRPSARPRGRARTTKASLPASAGRRRGGRTRPTRRAPPTRTCRPSS